MTNVKHHEFKPDLGKPPALAPAVRRAVSGRRYSCKVDDAIHFVDESNDRTEYQPDLSVYLPLLTPKLTKAGKVAVRQPVIFKQSLKWWKAQCGFRGLPVGGTVQELQSRIREHGDGRMDNLIADVRAAMVMEYRDSNSVMVEEIWSHADDNKKADIWPRRLLHETFAPSSERASDVLAIKVGDWGNTIERMSRAMGLHCELRKLPEYETGQRTAFIGTTQQAVVAGAAEVDREIHRAESRRRRERERKAQEARDEFDRELEAARSKKGPAAESSWQVGGKWRIRCPSIEAEWGDTGEECSLKLCLADDGSSQMYALFDFIAITGLMRFIGPNNSSSAYRFSLPPGSLPSRRHRDFRYRWRGEESDEDVIQLDSDRVLRGEFDSAYTGTVAFTGVRVDGVAYHADPGYEWSRRDQAAYDQANRDRWR